MKSQEVAIKPNLNISLKPDSETLDEVVITAYGGSMKKSSLSGASSQLKGEKLSNQPVQSFDQAMAGKMAGVQITQSSGLLADGVSIRVRGTNSISLSSQPLVVIDGVPVTEKDNLNVFNGGDGTRFNPMATINPNDIETMEVLKDAAAAALFGSRAANGVLMITTKRGKEGKATVSYNGYIGVSKAANLPELLNGQQFIDITNEKASNRWGAGTVIAAWDENHSETNWLDETFRTGLTQNHSVSASGGTGKLSVYVSADWTKQEGIVIGNELERASIRLNADLKATDWLKVGMSANYSSTDNWGVLSDGYLAGVTVAAYNAIPNVPSMKDGDYYLVNGLLGSGNNKYSYNGVNTYLNAFYHPVATIELQRNKNTSDRLLANVYAEITPIKGLKITTKYSVDRMNNFEDQYSSPKINGLGSAYGGLVQDNTAWLKQWNWQNFANYSFTIKQHSFDIMAGMEYEKRTYKDIFAAAYNFVFDSYQDILDGLFTDQMSGGTMDSRGISSYFGRINYNWNNRYFLEASFRGDAYSGFSKNSRWGYFPGVSGAWRIKEENFLKDVEVLNDLKIRGSWGIVGNSNVDPYAYRTIYAGGQYADINGVSMNQVGNDGLQWEKVTKIDVGVDASFFDGKINLAFDYWRTNVNDMILDAPVIHIAGIPDSKITTNIGSMYNQGIELQLNTTNISTKDWRWTSTLNFTTVKNEVTALAGSDILETACAIVGEPLGVWRVYRYAGVDPQTGRAGYYDVENRIKYYDANPAVPTAEKWEYADGTLASPLGTDDLEVQNGKTGSPKWYGNFDNTVKYNDFDLSIGLQFAGGNYLLNQTRAGLLTTLMNNNLTEILDRWTTPGQVTDIPKLYHGDRTSVVSNSTLFLEKADFLRLRDITVGYTLPVSLTSKVGISMARVYLRGSNLAVLTGYSGSDPEISTNRNKNISVGFDNRSVPYPRTFTFGLNINF
ncbi:MAG: TonB-dependent receptor [Bacteroides sp.]|nr:TonB-dependent receptor [Bacteroides sp.]